MDVKTMKWVMGLSLVVMTYLGGFLPLKFKGNKHILSYGNIFSAGVFLGTGLLHMIPEAAEALEGHVDDQWKISYLVCGCGLILIVFFEELVLYYKRQVSQTRLRKRSESSNSGSNHEPSEEGRRRIEGEGESPEVIAQTVVESLNPRSSLISHSFIISDSDHHHHHEHNKAASPPSSPLSENHCCADHDPHLHYDPISKKLAVQNIGERTTTTTQRDEGDCHVGDSTSDSSASDSHSCQAEQDPEEHHQPHFHPQQQQQQIPAPQERERERERKRVTKTQNHHGHHDVEEGGHEDHHEIDKELLVDGLSLAYVLVVALSIHSFFESAALGASENADSAFSVWVAISSHKLLSSFALGSSLIRAQASKLTLFKLLTVFCLTTVIGILVGYGLTESTDSSTAEVVSGLANGLAAGTFFYIGLCDILPKELSERSKSLTVVCLKLGLFTVGFWGMSLLAVYGEHEHDHEHEHEE